MSHLKKKMGGEHGRLLKKKKAGNRLGTIKQTRRRGKKEMIKKVPALDIRHDGHLFIERGERTFC